MSRFLVLVSVASYLLLSPATAQVISKLPAELVYSSIELDPGEKARLRVRPGSRQPPRLLLARGDYNDPNQTPQSTHCSGLFLSSLFVNSTRPPLTLPQVTQGQKRKNIHLVNRQFGLLNSTIVLEVAHFSLIWEKSALLSFTRPTTQKWFKTQTVIVFFDEQKNKKKTHARQSVAL